MEGAKEAINASAICRGTFRHISNRW